MRYLRFLLILFFVLNSPLFVSSEEKGVLYLWEVSSGQVWENFGDEDLQQKFEGIISNGKAKKSLYRIF